MTAPYASPSRSMPNGARLPVAVIGAGPIGLAAAAHLLEKGETPLVLEAGDAVGAAIREWSHVRLFSPWKFLVDPAARRLLEPTGWTMPDPEHLPTGGELLDQYLEPLARLPIMARHVRVGSRVTSVSRRGFDKVKTTGRADAPFEVVVQALDGRTERVQARAVIDASGTWFAPNPLGASGLVAAGEVEHANRVRYGIPDVLGRERARYAGRRTVVVGSGHSAFNALLDLASLADEAPGTELVWAVRRQDIGLMFGGGQKDQLEARGALGTRLGRLVERGRVRLITGFRAVRVQPLGAAVTIESDDGSNLGPVDEIIVATGFRPDLTLARELRLELDPWLEAPVRLAPLIDPNVHSCGTVYPHGATELAHPEQDYYVVGMKSYGRAPTFLLLTGYEQVRSVACALVGDEAGARNVELVLPETGVCQTDLVGGTACCSTAPVAPTALGRARKRSTAPREARPVVAAPAAAVAAPEPTAVAPACGCGCNGNCDDHCDDTCRADAKATVAAGASACCA
ncbi:MAG TPA: NAD(P)-binding domain-containing protein [Gemmatimonadaceae bacterium]|nr:NAD(P)-binding domain-containing protein [Gemmatimonadaceae bacterium]